MKYAIIWIISAIAITVGIGGNIPNYYHLVKRGVIGQATVIELLPDIHNTVRYQYRILNKLFKSRSGLGPPNPSLEQVKVGQTVVIYYDPDNPDVSVLENPKPILINEIITVGLAVIICPTLLVSALVKKNFGITNFLFFCFDADFDTAV